MLRTLQAFLVAALVLTSPVAWAQPTALERYVSRPESAYGWRLMRTIPGTGATTYVLELTSQTWRSAAEVDKPVWKHWLTIVKPERLSSATGMLVIGQGENTDPLPTAASERTRQIAIDTGTVVAELQMVPNQPLRFSDTPGTAREEDDIIAYTRVKHFSTRDDTWLVRLAMVKSGVKAMDATQEFLASEAGGRVKVDRFVVTGASKRGWTAWLVAAVDERVIALAPLVIDALNSEAITRHHFEALGFFSSALDDYVAHGLFPHKIGTPEYQAVLAIEDPYNYRARARMKMPKFMINASGDQFFLPDNSQFYYGGLPEEKHIRYVPNARHDLGGSDALQSLIAFYQAVLTDTPRPRFSWTKATDGTLTVTPQDRPREVRLWQATNPKARDFRLDVIGPAYSATVLQPQADGRYLAPVTRPAAGWTARFIELTYDSGGKYPFKFTTEVVVTPDVLPFKWDDAAKRYPKTKP